MTKLFAFFISFVLITSSSALFGAVKTDESDEEKKGGRPGFSVGFQCHYTILDPVWSTSDFNKTSTMLVMFRAIYKPINYENGKAFNYNPVISVRFNNRVSLSGSYLYGEYSWKSMSYGITFPTAIGPQPSAFNQNFSVKKHDADLLINIVILDWLKVFIGPKYQGYIILEQNTVINNYFFGSAAIPVFPVKNPINFHSIGLGAGIGINQHVVAGLFFVSNISAIYLYGKDWKAAEGTIGNQTSNLFGGIGSAALAYYIDTIRMTFTAGIKAQYLSYTSTPRSVYQQKYDFLYGPYVGMVFTY